MLRRKQQENGENCIMGSFIICSAHHTSFMLSEQRMRWVGHVACVGAGTAAYRVLLQKPEGKRPLGRPRYRQNNNTKMDLKEMSLLYAVRCVNNITKTHILAFVYSSDSLYTRKCSSNVSIFRWTFYVHGTVHPYNIV